MNAELAKLLAEAVESARETEAAVRDAASEAANRNAVAGMVLTDLIADAAKVRQRLEHLATCLREG